MTPNAIFDQLPGMDPAELKVTLVLVRHTCGWHRTEWETSLTELQQLTGLSRRGVVDGWKAAEKRGFFSRRDSDRGFTYINLLVTSGDYSDRSEQSPHVTGGEGATSHLSAPPPYKRNYVGTGSTDDLKKGGGVQSRDAAPAAAPQEQTTEPLDPSAPPLFAPLQALFRDPGTSRAFADALRWLERQTNPEPTPDMVTRCGWWWLNVALAGKKNADPMRPRQLQAEWPRFCIWAGQQPARNGHGAPPSREERRQRDEEIGRALLAEKLARLDEQDRKEAQNATHQG